MNASDLIAALRRAGAHVGEHVFLGPDVYVELEFAPLLTIESGVVIARGVSLILHDSGLNNVAGAPLRFGRIILRENCYIGANATILCGVEVGARALVGAASLVNRSIPADHVAYGLPARVQGTIAELAARQATHTHDGLLDLPPWRERQTAEQRQHALDEIERFVQNLAAPLLVSRAPEVEDAPAILEASAAEAVAKGSNQQDTNMADTTRNNFFELDASSDTLRDILAQIDRNLVLRPLLGASAETNEGGLSALTLSLPSVQAINHHLSELQRLHSLVYLTDTHTAGRLAKQAINPLIRLVSRKQVLFNRELIDALSQLAMQTPALQQTIDVINELLVGSKRIEHTIATLAERIGPLEAAADEARQHMGDAAQRETRITDLERVTSALAAQSGEFRPWIEALTQEKSNHDTWLTKLTEDKESHERWLHRLGDVIAEVNQRLDGLAERVTRVDATEAALTRWSSQTEQAGAALSDLNQRLDRQSTELHGLSLWVTSLNDRVTDMTRQARDDQERQVADSARPRIIDPESYGLKIAAANGHLRLNLGAGDKPWQGYINIDARDMKGIDVVADVANLPYGAGEITEIASAHVVEHFREHYFRKTLLPYWRHLLRSGGILRIICPDWAAMQARLQNDTMSWETYKLLTFGGQDYVGNDHFAMYTPDSLGKVLSIEGFVNVKVVASDRMNDICPEMELTAERP